MGCITLSVTTVTLATTAAEKSTRMPALSLSLFLSLSLSVSQTQALTHTHTHTHSQTLSCQASFSVRFFSNRPDILFSFQFLFHFFISFLSPFFSGHRNFEFLNEMRALRHSKSSVKWLSGVWVEGGGGCFSWFHFQDFSTP